MSRGGRRYGRAHLPVESCHSLSAWGYFQRAQMWGREDDDNSLFEWTGDDAGTYLEIKFTRDGREHTQRIFLTFTRCNYGGRRNWFLCPLCERRVGKVYLPCTMHYAGDERVSMFACRYCYNLTYLQRQDRSPYWCYLYRADKIGERWFGEITDDFIYKRKGQYWRTFNKRFDQYQELIECSNTQGLIKMVNIGS